MKKVLLYILYAVITFFSFALKYECLSNISISGETLVPIFNKNIYKYNIYTDKNEININGVLEEEDNYIEGTGKIELKDGENNISLKLVLKNGEIKHYNLVVFLNYKNQNDSSNSLLKKLKIKGYDINFDSNIFNYNLNIKDEEYLTIEYECVSENAKVLLEGNSNLKLGNNKIIITVTSEDKENKSIYTLNINKIKTVFKESETDEKNNVFKKSNFTDKDKLVLKISIVTIIGIIIITLMYLLFFTRKQKKKH